MNILGVSGALDHDASAALLIDGELVSAVEEERLIRDKHAKKKWPMESVRYCLQQAGLKPSDIHHIAFPFAPISLSSRARWHYAKRYWYAPDRALDAFFNGNRHFRRNKKGIFGMLSGLGFDMGSIPFMPVEHHLAHASSAYHLSDFDKDKKCAIVTIDGKGEYATTLFAVGEAGKIKKIKEFYDPDSLGGFFGAITQYLGFEMLDGEFKVMGMAPYGDAKRFDLSRLLEILPDGSGFRVNTKLLNTVGLRRYKKNGEGFYFSQKLVDWLGPKREGDAIDEPYIHYAAAVQALLEDASLKLIDHHLGGVLKETGSLCFAGGVALNVKLNQRLIDHPDVKELFVQPAAGDAGTAVGAATFAASQLGETIKPMRHVYLGPHYSNEECIAACQQHPSKPKWQRLDDAVKTGAEILAQGSPLAWLQGRMEFGPRALGNRSILGNPSAPGIAERINLQIKYRERWRPFCPSILDTVAQDMLQTTHPSPYMTFAFHVQESWKTRVPEVVHVDGTARTQVVTKETNPRYYALISALAEKTGNAVVLNTSLNRRGEPMVCSPTDALNMFFGSDLQYLIMEDVLVTK